MADQATKYPVIETEGRGFRVRTGRNGYLPGIYLNHLMAERAVKKHVNSMKEAKAAKRK